MERIKNKDVNVNWVNHKLDMSILLEFLFLEKYFGLAMNNCSPCRSMITYSQGLSCLKQDFFNKSIELIKTRYKTQKACRQFSYWNEVYSNSKHTQNWLP